MRFRLTKVKVQLISIALLITAFSMEGCLFFTNDPEPETELDKLPPATQTGENTFGCLVNGKAWVATTQIDAYATYQQGILSIGAESNSPDSNFGLALIENGTIVDIGTYSLILPPDQYAHFFTYTCFYYQEDTFDGNFDHY